MAYHFCRWCGRMHDDFELKIESGIGPICESCIEAIRSRGEKLTLTDFDDDEYEEWKKKHETSRRRDNGTGK